MSLKFLPFLIILFTAVTLLVVIITPSPQELASPLSTQPSPTPTPLSLLKYTFQNLKNQTPESNSIHLESIIEETPSHTSHLFSYTSEGKRITGQLNHPTTATPSAGFPIILMIRGFIDPEIYQTGMGTKNAAAFYASNGFATLAPDFLGFGGSDNPSSDVIEARLEKPASIITLINSLSSLPFINPDQLSLWGHSNGGQITLSVLEITGKEIPTTLWAPVSKPFPYSILYYTDQFDDQGKALRQVVADFEDHYDVFDFSIDQYWHWIRAPIQIHQGTADPDIPVNWSDQLVENLEDQDLDITYHIYRGADHNLRPDWSSVVQRDLDFFNQNI